MNKLIKEEKRIRLPFLLGSDKLRFLGTDRIKHNMGQRGENAVLAAIIDAIPQLDITKYLSKSSKDVLEQAGSVARSFNKDVIGTTHLLFALIKHDSISNFFDENKINATKLNAVLTKRIEKGIIPDFILRKKQTKLSREVELLLKDTLETNRTSYLLIEPIHIFLELLKKDYPKISKILRNADIKVSNLVRMINDEINKSL